MTPRKTKIIRVGAGTGSGGDGDRKHFRIGKILARLNEGPVHLRGLADEFRVAKRSIERDMDRIELYGYTLERPKAGWRKFAEGVSLKKSTLSVEQQAALVVLSEIANGLGPSIRASFEPIFRHLSEAGPAESVIVPVMPRIINTSDPPHIKQVEAAIKERRKLRIKYFYEGRSEIVERTLCPVRILISEGNGYVLAISERAHATPVKYRLDKIRELETTEESFEPPANVEEILRKSRSIWGVIPDARRDTVVKLRVEQWARDYFRHQELVGGQQVSELPDGALLYEARIGEFMEIIPHILRWIPYVTVIEPLILKRVLRARISAYLRK